MNNKEEKTGKNNYILDENIINEKSSDNDFDYSNLNENDFHLNDPNSLYEREFHRFKIEYIKVLGLYQNEKSNDEININEIVKEYKIPGILMDINIEEENKNIKEEEEILEDEYKEDKIDFDNDIQPLPSLNQEMKIIIYLSKPKIVGFDGKLGLFYVTPPPIGRESDFYLIIKNPENMKLLFKIKLMEIITCLKKNENSLIIQNFGSKILMKSNHEMYFKNKEDCAMVYQGITYLMNNKEDYLFD